MSFKFKIKIRGGPDVCNFKNTRTKIAEIKIEGSKLWT
jgi:hypothetical protein